ncbi:MAG: hypothetical protein C6P37_13070 [Caldibacillus debilis]|uniref:Uncharacterized protein n=1 Tax=Caldibacillus debilis TaxID=301148 RepID=A0A3E0K1S4_9BACI|nr:MAG: hypothetical protein C6P37_13070 [Caldibacillus debilis]
MPWEKGVILRKGILFSAFCHVTSPIRLRWGQRNESSGRPVQSASSMAQMIFIENDLGFRERWMPVHSQYIENERAFGFFLF